MNEPCAIPDPLEAAVELPLCGRFHVKGFPVEIATNSPLVLEAAAESWRCFPAAFDQPQARLRIVVHDDGSGVPPEPIVRSQGHLLTQIADRNNFAVCDLERGFAFSRLSASTAACQDYVRYHFLEGTAACIHEYLCLTSLHAACVAWKGRAVLLFGESGAGKSCLSFACARRGWTLISEDGSALVRGRNDNFVVGDPHGLRFRASAVALFPELGTLPLSITREGERTIEVCAGSLPIATAWNARVERVVFLRRQEGRANAELLPVAEPDAMALLVGQLAFWGEQVQREQIASLGSLLRQDAWELRYGELDPAVDALAGLVERGNCDSH